MEQSQNDAKSGKPDSSGAPRKSYTPPEVRLLGRMSDRTLGINGSRFDPGHHNNSKLGMG
jgi:hypothetical protein